MSERDLKLRVLFNMVEKITAPLKKIQASTNASAESVKNLRKKLGDLNDQQSQIAGFKRLHNSLRETSEQLVGAEIRAAQLKAQIESSVNPNKTLWREYDRAQNKVKLLNNALHTEGTQLDQIQTKLHQAGIRTEKLAHHEQMLQNDLNKTNRSLQEQKSHLDAIAAKTHKAAQAKKLYQRTQAFAGKMAMAGAGMGAAGAVGAAALKAPVSAYANAEDSKIQLKVSMMQSGGKVSEEFEKINALAMKLGDKLPGTTSDYLDMMTMLQRQGLSANNVLGGTGEATALLAVQLKKLPSEAAEFAAKMQDATRTSEGDMLKLMDTIQRTFYLGVDDNDMLQAITKMSPAMKTLRKEGIDAANALAPLIVMFDQAGMKGESGGNAMRKVFDLGLDKEKREKVNKALKPQGINLNFSDGKGEFAGIDHMFAEFAKLKNLNRETTLAALKGQFGDDAETQQVLTILIDKGKAGYVEVIDKMQAQADLQTRVNAQLGTLKNLWEAASGTFTNALVAFGESISPELKAITNWIGEVSASTGAWARENPVLSSTLMKIAAIVTIVLIVLGGLLISISALLMPLAMTRFAFAAIGLQGGILSSVLRVCTSVFTRLGTVIKFIGTVFMWVGRLFMANPILLAIGLLITAVYLIYKNWEPIKQFFTNLWSATTRIFTAGVSAIQQYLSSAWGWVSGVFDNVWSTIKTAFGGGIAGVSTLILNWSPLGLFYQALASVLSYFNIELPAKFSEFGANIIDGLITGIKNKAVALKDAVVETADSVSNWFAEKMGIHSPSRVFMRFGSDTIDGYTAGLEDKQSAPLSIISSMAQRVSQLGAILGAGLAIGSNPAMAGPIQFDSRKPLASVNASATQTPASTFHITINPTPGMDPNAIAKAVAAELDRRERQQAARSRSSLHDNSAY